MESPPARKFENLAKDRAICGFDVSLGLFKIVSKKNDQNAGLSGGSVILAVETAIDPGTAEAQVFRLPILKLPAKGRAIEVLRRRRAFSNKFATTASDRLFSASIRARLPSASASLKAFSPAAASRHVQRSCMVQTTSACFEKN